MNKINKQKKNTLQVAIIILNWNGIEDTRICLNSLRTITYPFYKIFIVDNGSRKKESEMLKKEFGNQIHIIPLKENQGFTGGVNCGISTAKKHNPDFYLLLNNDTEVDPHFLEYLVDSIASDEKAGIVGPTIYDLKNKHEIIYSGGTFNWFLARPHHTTEKISSRKKVLFVNGGAMLIKKELIKKIGLLDDRFFAYFEDVAYCFMARNAGYFCICEPKSIIYHKVSGSSDRKGKFYSYLLSRNRILFVNNYFPLWYRVYFLLFNFIKLIGVFCYFYTTNQKARLSGYFIGYLDGTLGRGGSSSI